jgi:hypothetical protein
MEPSGLQSSNLFTPPEMIDLCKTTRVQPWVLRRLAQHLAVCIVYLALAVAITWPLATAPSRYLLIGAEPSATVPLLNLWTIWWNVDRLNHGYRDYWHAPIFHPTDDAFTYSEPQTAVGWFAYPLWGSLLSPAGVYNTLLLLFLTLNGWASFLVLRRCRLVWYVSAAGGAYVTVLPMVHWQISVFQLVSLWGVAGTVWALIRFQRVPSVMRALQIGVAFAITYLLCCYHGLFFSVLLMCGAPLLFGRRLLQRRFWIGAALALTTACLLLAPVVSAQLQVAERRPKEYPAQWIEKLSTSPLDYLRTPWPQWLASATRQAEKGLYQWPLSPGSIKTMLAVVGCVWGVWSFRRRRVALFLGIIAVMAVLLSMGPRLEVAGLSPHTALAKCYPGFAHVRNLFRFAFFYQWSVAILAAFGLQAVLLGAASLLPPKRRWMVGVVIGVAAILVVFETWPSQRRLYELPEFKSASAWVGWVEDNVAKEEALVFLPLPEDQKAKSFLPTGEWMYFQMWHRRAIANGYSAMLPREYARLNRAMQGFPTVGAIEALQAAGIRYCVLDRKRGADYDEETMRELGLTMEFDHDASELQFWLVPASSLTP